MRFRATSSILLLFSASMLFGLDTGTTPSGGHSIIGGTTTTNAKYPWMVGLVTSSEASNYDAQFCGGTLVHPHWVVTAAHCLEGETTTSFRVLIGATNLETDTAVQRISVSQIIMHPDYDPRTDDNDIALLRLATPVTGRAVCELIDDPAQANPGVNATTIGWGAVTGDGKTYDPLLREVTIPIVSLATANTVYGGSLTARMLPAGLAAGGKDSCSGDSGGPLVVRSSDDSRWLLAGVVSFGADDLDCAAPGNYGIYARVTSFRNWILSYTQPNYAAFEAQHGVAGDRLDPDGDGATNWLEFLRGNNPNSGANAFVETTGRTTVSGQAYGTYTFRRRPAAEVETQVWFSANGFSNWTQVNVAAQLVGSALPVPGVSGLETVTVRAPSPVSQAGAGYFRLVGRATGNYVPRL